MRVHVANKGTRVGSFEYLIGTLGQSEGGDKFLRLTADHASTN